jgi:hypothetical protein
VIETSGRVLCLGEDNPYGSEPEFALYCYPPGCAGYRLRRIFGLPQHQYLALHRKNLCDSGAWSTKVARERARQLHADSSMPWSVIVLLGRKVADAFGYEGPFFTTSRSCDYATGHFTFVSLPHPSGRNAASWNPQARDRARQILREVAPEVPWGSVDGDAVQEEAVP